MIRARTGSPSSNDVATDAAIDSDPRFAFLLVVFLDTLATLHVAWFYLSRVPSALNLLAYEQGSERSPFQHRMLMMLPLRWAHQSSTMNGLAARLTRMPGWFGAGVSPEGLMQAGVDLASIVCTGLIARRVYRAASGTGLLTPFIYPLTLLMIAATYTLQTNHALRFVYDLPALAFFSMGFYLLYFRRHRVLFAALFVVATVNRETSLLLLPMYWTTQWMPASDCAPRLHLVHSQRLESCADNSAHWRWRRLWAPPTLALSFPLLAWWVGWHLWTARHFAANTSVSGPRLYLNLATLLCPIAWPQLLSAAAFLWPLPILYRRFITDPTLRAWLWLPAAWLGLMLFYGLLIESRIFGELIPYFACTTALIAEQLFLDKLIRVESPDGNALPC